MDTDNSEPMRKAVYQIVGQTRRGRFTSCLLLLDTGFLCIGERSCTRLTLWLCCGHTERRLRFVFDREEISLLFFSFLRAADDCKMMVLQRQGKCKCCCSCIYPTAISNLACICLCFLELVNLAKFPQGKLARSRINPPAINNTVSFSCHLRREIEEKSFHETAFYFPSNSKDTLSVQLSGSFIYPFEIPTISPPPPPIFSLLIHLRLL